MGIDEYNYYIQYLCLFMFTDGFSHFISVSGVLCLFRCYALRRPPCENSPIKVKKKKTIMVYSVMVFMDITDVLVTFILPVSLAIVYIIGSLYCKVLKDGEGAEPRLSGCFWTKEALF